MDVEVVTTREKLISFIIQKEIVGGGFALSGSTPDPDVTAMAIQALAPYKNRSEVQGAIERAVAVLDRIQLDNGGYKSWGSENVQSSAQVLVALSTIGIDAATDERFIAEDGSSILSNILTYYTTDGGFAHPKVGSTNSMATVQSTYALAAYERFINNQKSLYDMSDVTLKTTEPKPTEPEVTEKKPIEPEVTEPKPTEPEVTEPKPIEPEVTEPKPTEPEVTEPKPTEIEVKKQKLTEIEVTEQKLTEIEVTEQKLIEPEVTEPKVNLSIVISSSEVPLKDTAIKVIARETVFDVLKTCDSRR